MLIGIAFIPITAFAQSLSSDLKQADDLDWQGDYIKEKAILLAAEKRSATGAEKAEIYWRLSRVVLNITDDKLDNKQLSTDQALKEYEVGESYANVSIQNNPHQAEAYFWKSANIGRWGQTKGILDSLFKAGQMNDNLRLALQYNPNYADAYYVLSELYEQLPGWPVSFGNVEYSVSLGRKAVALAESDLGSGKIKSRNYGAHIALANHLWNRNWDTGKRASMKPVLLRQYNNTANPIDKNYFFESTVSIKSISDREEAREILTKIIAELQGLGNRTNGQNTDLANARKKLAEYK